jgi:tetratricopeptide (TPR) repeat protein
MSQSRTEDRVTFERLKEDWQAAIQAGELELAREIIERALSWARGQGESRLVDAAICAWAAIEIELGRGESELSSLRQILLKNSDPSNCWLAAYNLSHHYELAKNYKKSLFYARIHCDRAELLGRADWRASSENQIGNALLGESFVEQACSHYEKALELIPEEPSLRRALIQHNLGYCRILQQRYKEGYRLLYTCIGVLRRLGGDRYQVSPRLDLCFAHLETGRYRLAQRQGLAALELAEKTGHAEGVKNALYLLGEAANLCGDAETARCYFSRLQAEFFPGSSYLPGFLLAVDVRKLVNLHA